MCLCQIKGLLKDKLSHQICQGPTTALKTRNSIFFPTGFLDLQAIQNAQPTQIFRRDNCLLSSLICRDALISCIEKFKKGQFHI